MGGIRLVTGTRGRTPGCNAVVELLQLGGYLARRHTDPPHRDPAVAVCREDPGTQQDLHMLA